MQLEQCPQTRRQHWQGYLELKGSRRVHQVTIRNEVPALRGARLEVRRGSQQQAIAYARKEDTRIGDRPIELGTPHQDRRQTQARQNEGGRQFLENLALRVHTQSIGEMDISHPYEMIMIGQKIQDYRNRRIFKQYAGKRIENATRTLLWGDTGSMKTSSIYQIIGEDSFSQLLFQGSGMSRTYWMSKQYDPVGDLHVIIDDYDGETIPITDLLKILDTFPNLVPFKGGEVLFMARHVWITTNKPLEDWYPYDRFPGVTEEQRKALKRRFTKIIKCKRTQQVRLEPEEIELNDVDIVNALKPRTNQEIEEID